MSLETFGQEIEKVTEAKMERYQKERIFHACEIICPKCNANLFVGINLFDTMLECPFCETVLIVWPNSRIKA